jgi:cobalt-zinc-cadmium efflux system membrane fusion protein
MSPSLAEDGWRAMRLTRLLVLLIVVLAPAALCPPAKAEPPVLAPRLDARGSEFELLGIAKGDSLTVYLDDVKTNEPVAKAKFSIDVGDNAKKLMLKETEPGLYWGQADWLARPGSTDFVISVKVGKRSDLLGGTLKVPEPPPVLTTFWVEWQSRITFLAGFLGGIGTLWLLRMLLRPRRPAQPVRPAVQKAPSAAAAGAGTAATVVAVVLLWACTSSVLAMPAGPGHSHGPDDVTVDVAPDNQPPDSPRRLADGSLFVPKPAQRVLAIRTTITATSEIAVTTRVFGRIIADPTASGRIQAGIQGRIIPGDQGLFVVGQHVDRDQIVCSVVPILNPVDNANIVQQLSQIDGEVRQLNETAEQAASGEIAPLSQRDMQTMKLDLMSLKQRREGISLVMNDRESLRIPLRSPSTGIIAISNVLAGQIVEAKDILFEVIDPNRIWVEAAAFDMDVVNNLAGAIAVTDAGKTYQLTYIGRAPRLRQQAIPLNFKIDNPDNSLTVGSPANVYIKGHNMRTAVVLPQRAITTTASGQSIVFEHVSAEHFVPVIVRSEDVDGTNAVIVAGLEPGRRIVLDGAGLLGQIR